MEAKFGFTKKEIRAKLAINVTPDVSNFATKEDLQKVKEEIKDQVIGAELFYEVIGGN